jgi:DNA-binding NarL/FixJ family response regulator
MPVIVEREVVVFSKDGTVRREVRAVVARRPGARAVFARPDGPWDAGITRGAPVVVLDDEGRTDAIELIERLKARKRDAQVVYLAARHSTTLEEAVRRAGASFYAVKSLRDGDLTRVIEVLLGPGEP